MPYFFVDAETNAPTHSVEEAYDIDISPDGGCPT